MAHTSCPCGWESFAIGDAVQRCPRCRAALHQQQPVPYGYRPYPTWHPPQTRYPAPRRVVHEPATSRGSMLGAALVSVLAAAICLALGMWFAATVLSVMAVTWSGRSRHSSTDPATIDQAGPWTRFATVLLSLVAVGLLTGALAQFGARLLDKLQPGQPAPAQVAPGGEDRAYVMIPEHRPHAQPGPASRPLEGYQSPQPTPVIPRDEWQRYQQDLSREVQRIRESERKEARQSGK